MANTMTGNIWKIDTAASLRTNPLYVYKMWWTPAAAGDDISILDAGGNTIWGYKTIAGETTQTIVIDWPGSPAVLNGINVATLDSGTLYIHIQ